MIICGAAWYAETKVAARLGVMTEKWRYDSAG